LQQATSAELISEVQGKGIMPKLKQIAFFLFSNCLFEQWKNCND
jgi:hypothetical protein